MTTSRRVLLITRAGVVLLRFAVVALELIAEALGLGVFFGLLLAPTEWRAIAVGAVPVIYVLFVHGYYFTRPLLGLLWRGGTSLYAFLAAALFVFHMFIGYYRLQPDMTPHARTVALPFFAGGAAIVFLCARFGRTVEMRLRAR